MKYLIGEMAKLNKISTQTLRHYDRIGLFSPTYVDVKTGYRYYTLNQFQTLQTINYLKFIGLSLDSIKGVLKEKNIVNILEQLESQKQVVENKLDDLVKVKENLDFKTNMIKSYLEVVDYSEVWIEDIDPFYVFSRRVNSPLDLDEDFIIEMNKLVDQYFDDLFIYTGDIGVTVGMDNIEKDEFTIFKDVFYATNNKSNPKCKIIERGLCVRALHKGSFSKTFETYKKMKAYAKKSGYEIVGDSVELAIVDIMVVDNEDDLLLDISIPVRKK